MLSYPLENILKILLIEDSRVDRLVIVRTLTSLGAIVEENDTGLLNLQSITDKDLVILDVNLPYRNGLDILKDIRQVSDIPVIMFSSVLKVQEARKNHANAYLKKPLRIRDIEEIMRKLYLFWEINQC